MTFAFNRNELDKLVERLNEYQVISQPELLENIQNLTRNVQMPVAGSFASDFQELTEKYTKLYPVLEQANPSFFSESIERIASNLQVPISKLRYHQYELTPSNFEEKEEKLIEVIDNVEEILHEIYKDEKLLEVVDPRKFEEIVARLLEKKGFTAELTQRTRDGGYDILALKKIEGIPFNMLVECKRKEPVNKVGINVIRNLCDVVHEQKANKGMVVTTSYFSKPAHARSDKEGHLLDLTDRERLLHWIVKDFGNT